MDRILISLLQVIDSSDLLLHVLDARDPLGTKCESVEAYLAKEKRGKKVVYILNKVDLVPGWVAVSRISFRLVSASFLCFLPPLPSRHPTP